MRVGALQDWPELRITPFDAELHRPGDVGIGSRMLADLAAELLVDALHRIRRRLGDEDAGAGRAGEGHHVDIRWRAMASPTVGRRR